MSPKRHEDEDIKRMVDLLRQGSTLTELACPACAAPLFRLRNRDIWCAKCQKKIVVVREGEESSKIADSIAVENLEKTLLFKIQEIQDKIQREHNVEQLQKLGSALSGLLENLERTRKIRRA